MNWKCFLISIVFLFLKPITTASSQQLSSPLAEISHISFSENHIFYLSKEGNHFGFISRETGQIMTSYKMQEQETIISVDKPSDSVILRSGRNKVLLFDIRSSHLQEITVRITFNHQQIIDALKLKEKYYVLTDKDLRVYDQNQQKMGESLKNIITSGRKNQFFKKFFLRAEESIEDMLIVLIKNGQVCLRTFKKVKRGTDQCYFKIPYDIIAIDRINSTILIQTNTVNYVISQDSQSSYSFDGKVTQINGDFIQLSNFKTYDLKNQVFLDGAIVEGSKINEVFWIHPSGDNQMSIYFNSILIKELETMPKRSWFTKAKTLDTYDLLLEFEENRFEMYQISIKNGNANNFSLKWTNKSLKFTDITSEL